MAKVAVLSDEEKKIFEKNLSRMGEIVDDIFSDGVPETNRDKRLALEAMEKQNESVLKLAEIRSKAEQEQGDEAVKSMVVALLKETRRIKQEPVEREFVDIDENEVDPILPTALSMEREELNIEEFTGDPDDS